MAGITIINGDRPVRPGNKASEADIASKAVLRVDLAAQSLAGPGIRSVLGIAELRAIRVS